MRMEKCMSRYSQPLKLIPITQEHRARIHWFRKLSLGLETILVCNAFQGRQAIAWSPTKAYSTQRTWDK